MRWGWKLENGGWKLVNGIGRFNIDRCEMELYGECFSVISIIILFLCFHQHHYNIKRLVQNNADIAKIYYDHI